eukprot:m.45857 g.45857  ORF g.45857 m.45857 type:complete len:143 (+) comp33635_c0_seq13:1460-1888(+)
METVVEQALRSIARICYSVPAAVDDIVMGGEDIKEILDLMTLHQDSAAVQRASCLLIYALAYKDLTGRKALIKFGAIKQILVILENFLENPLALMMAYSVLACLSAQSNCLPCRLVRMYLISVQFKHGMLKWKLLKKKAFFL